LSEKKILGRKTRPGVNAKTPGSKTNSSIEYLLLVEILEAYTELIFHYKVFLYSWWCERSNSL